MGLQKEVTLADSLYTNVRVVILERKGAIILIDHPVERQYWIASIAAIAD